MVTGHLASVDDYQTIVDVDDGADTEWPAAAEQKIRFLLLCSNWRKVEKTIKMLSNHHKHCNISITRSVRNQLKGRYLQTRLRIKFDT